MVKARSAPERERLQRGDRGAAGPREGALGGELLLMVLPEQRLPGR
jgi:hypothetical protein